MNLLNDLQFRNELALLAVCKGSFLQPRNCADSVPANITGHYAVVLKKAPLREAFLELSITSSRCFHCVAWSMHTTTRVEDYKAALATQIVGNLVIERRHAVTAISNFDGGMHCQKIWHVNCT